MSIRTVGDLVFAANAAKKLSALGKAYLLNFRAHANGVNGINIPSTEFAVIPSGMELGNGDSPRLSFAIVWVHRSTWQEPEYYSPEDEMFDERWGSDNVSGYTTKTSDHPESMIVNIPASHLLQTSEAQVLNLKAIAAKADENKREQRRLERVEKLKAELAQLEGSE